jgi:CheY-like chemotaxis protein
MTAADILAASSEEFRDSLQTIRGSLELLVAGKVPDQEKASQFLQIAYRETGYLSHRVSDLHLAALIEADRLRLKLTTLSLEQLLDHLLQELAAPAADQEVSLQWDHDPELPNLQADEALLRTALTNMLELALRATPRQGSLQVRAVGQPDRISLRIECRARPDNGGAAGPDLRAADGQSLALYVARRIAQAHDGKLESGMASRDWQALELTLPLQPKARRRGRVLVVDDNPQAAFLLEYALQEEGYEPVKAMNGPDALKLARSERFDLIILDVLLPGIDGFEVCHRLRATPDTASVPVIMVSAKAREEDQSTALRIGADAYFGKPLGMAELMAAIADLLEAGDSRGRHGDR